MLLSILGASLLGNILAGKGVTTTSEICVCNKSWWVQINWNVLGYCLGTITYLHGNNFNSFGVEHISKGIKNI